MNECGEKEVFEQIDFDDILNQCAAVKEKRILGLKLSSEQKKYKNVTSVEGSPLSLCGSINFSIGFGLFLNLNWTD